MERNWSLAMPVGPIKGARASGPISLSEVLRYLFELFIFFIGVYLAFLLTDYQDERREREIQVKYYESLIYEIDAIIGHLDGEERKLKAHLAVLDEMEKGSKPHIPVSDLNLLHRGLVIGSAFESQHFEALDTRIIQQIVFGMPALDSLDQYVRSFNDLSPSLLVLQLDRDSCCYDEDGTLLPHLEWYPRLVNDIHKHNRQIRVGFVERALPEIRLAKEKLEQSII